MNIYSRTAPNLRAQRFNIKIFGTWVHVQNTIGCYIPSFARVRSVCCGITAIITYATNQRPWSMLVFHWIRAEHLRTSVHVSIVCVHAAAPRSNAVGRTFCCHFSHFKRRRKVWSILSATDHVCAVYVRVYTIFVKSMLNAEFSTTRKVFKKKKLKYSSNRYSRITKMDKSDGASIYSSQRML